MRADPFAGWEAAGVEYLLGYNWTCWYDYDVDYEVSVTKNIIQEWLANKDTMGNVGAWHEANNNMFGWNACAIESDNAYFYFKRYSGGIRVWETVLKESW